jgi:hypothetical protein
MFALCRTKQFRKFRNITPCFKTVSRFVCRFWIIQTVLGKFNWEVNCWLDKQSKHWKCSKQGACCSKQIGKHIVNWCNIVGIILNRDQDYESRKYWRALNSNKHIDRCLCIWFDRWKIYERKDKYINGLLYSIVKINKSAIVTIYAATKGQVSRV